MTEYKYKPRIFLYKGKWYMLTSAENTGDGHVLYYLHDVLLDIQEVFGDKLA